MKWEVQDYCPMWPLVGGFSRGKWTDCEIEFFDVNEEGPGTHAHFYTRNGTLEEARQLYRGALKAGMKFPATITSMSYKARPLEEELALDEDGFALY